MSEESLSQEEVIDRIATALTEIDGDELTRIHNEICDDGKVEYEGDSIWRVIS